MNVSTNTTTSPLWSVAFSLEGVLILVSNVVTVLTFLLHKHLRKRSVFLLINLSVADLLVGLIPVPLYVYFVGSTSGLWPKTALPLHQLLTHVYTYLDIFLGLTSIVTLACISLERMRATTWPLRHRSTTNNMYSGVIAMIWLSSSSIAGLAIYIKIYHFEYDIYAAWISVSILLFSLCIILTSYSVVFASFKRSSNRQSKLGHTNKTIYRENRLAITLFIVTMASLLAWVPFVVLNGIHYYSSIKFTDRTQHSIKLLHYSNSLINTFIYASRMHEFKRALISVLCKCSTLQTESPPNTNLTAKKQLSPSKNGDARSRLCELSKLENISDSWPILNKKKS